MKLEAFNWNSSFSSNGLTLSAGELKARADHETCYDLICTTTDRITATNPTGAYNCKRCDFLGTVKFIGDFTVTVNFLIRDWSYKAEITDADLNIEDKDGWFTNVVALVGLTLDYMFGTGGIITTSMVVYFETEGRDKINESIDSSVQDAINEVNISLADTTISIEGGTTLPGISAADITFLIENEPLKFMALEKILSFPGNIYSGNQILSWLNTLDLQFQITSAGIELEFIGPKSLFNIALDILEIEINNILISNGLAPITLPRFKTQFNLQQDGLALTQIVTSFEEDVSINFSKYQKIYAAYGRDGLEEYIIKHKADMNSDQNLTRQELNSLYSNITSSSLKLADTCPSYRLKEHNGVFIPKICY